MQILYLWDTHQKQDHEMARQLIEDTTEDAFVRERSLEMATAAWEQREASDRWVERLAPQWPPSRQPSVDRNLLRLAVWELINTQTPPRVVIDEAIEMAKHFSTDQSAGFINGILDAIFKEHRGPTGK